MDLKSLTNEQLHQSTKASVGNERDALKIVLLHVVEVQRRHMYLDYGRSSLFEYLTKDMGYANGCAQRRIDAARLSLDVPELIDQLENGDLNLGQVTVVKAALRQVEAENKFITADLKQEVVSEIVGKSIEESQVIVAKSFGVKIKEETKVRHQADESVRLELTLTKEQWVKFQEMRELLSHSTSSGSWDQVFEHVADKVIQEKNKILQRKFSSKKRSVDTKSTQDAKVQTSKKQKVDRNTVSDETESSKSGVRCTSRTAIPSSTLRELFKKQTCCQFEDKKSGRKCGSKWQLQTDHVIPIWAGGDNSLGNLQRLCSKHNRLKYSREAGIRNV